MTKSLDLATLLPKRYRDKTIDALIGNLFNQHLSKPDAETFHGYVGSTDTATATDIYLDETDIERQANQLAPALYVKAATDEDVTSWADLVQRMNLLGISYNNLADWFSIGTHNFVPPVDFDKLINFQEYLWIGQWLLEDSALPYSDLGIPASATVAAAMTSNPSYLPDYYVVARDTLNVAPPTHQGGLYWSDWASGNLWVHKDDATAFFNQHGASLTFTSATVAKRPIIEIAASVMLNEYVDAAGAPTEAGAPGAVSRPQRKVRINQPVQLDLFYHNGQHAGLTSAGFFYQESPDASVDPVLGRRVVMDGENFIFQHGFTHPTNGRLLWFKSYEGDYTLRNMWVGHAGSSEGTNTRHDAAEYIKYSTIGTVLNLDKLTNYQDYFWVNNSSEPEYNTIAGGTSDWALENAWVHVASLTYAQRLAATPAARPIVEFNANLADELLSQTKTSRHELPHFRIYRKTGPEALIYPSSTDDPGANDSYTGGVLFARLADLDADLQQAILASSELSARLLLKVKGELYVQSLANGAYRGTRDGATYGFTMREVTRRSQGDGQLLMTSANSTTSVPRIMKLIALNDTTFTAYSYETPAAVLTTVTVGTPVTLDGVTFTVLAGAIPFVSGDTIVAEVRSVIYERMSLYCKVGNEFKTFGTADGFLTDSVIRKLVPADVQERDGAWLAHPALGQNLDAANGLTFNQADLITHFASIIEAQPTFTGNSFGRNNWRLMSGRKFAMGGLIKQIDQRLALFLSTLIQPGITPATLLEVSTSAYEQMLSRIREYVEDRIIEDAVAGTAVLAGGSVSVNDATIQLLIKYLEGDAFEGDLGVGRPYFDTTMPIKALTLTAPYLGLSTAVQPAQALDPELGIISLTHHDGHRTPYPSIDESVIKRLVMKLFTRSSGQVTAGIVTGPTPPTKPFAKQLWLDLSSMTLFIFDVVSDVFAQPSGAAYGAFTFDRESGEVAEYDGATWTSLGASQITQDSCWRQVDLAKTLAQLTLGIETILYEHAPTSLIYDGSSLEITSRYNLLMQKEFEAFAAKHGIVDPYATNYDANNPFTWNYADSGPVVTVQAWQQLYVGAFGTARPDLEPWVIYGLTEAAWLALMITATLLPGGTTTFDPATMWPAVWATVRSYMVSNSIPSYNPGALPVNSSTGELYPPYTFGAYAHELITTVPTTAAANFTFGALGPIEMMWYRTTDSILAQNRTLYRLDPLNFTDTLWGDDVVAVNGYRMLERTGNKARIQDVLIHGQSNTSEHPAFIANIAVATLPTYDVTVTVAISRYDTAIVDIGSAPLVVGTPTPGNTASVNTGTGISFDITHPLEGFRVGAVATISIDALGVATVSYSFPAYDVSSGLAQLMVHSLRRASIDAALTQALARLTAWEPRLSYRFNALIDTESLLIKLNDAELTKSNIRVLLDEVRYKSSQWFSALKVTLFRKGAAERRGNIMVPALSAVSGRRGDDWAYRVDVLSQVGPGIQWYTMTGPGETFIALGGTNTVDEWLRPETVGALNTSKGPFLITGIQSLINFLWGYAVRQHELGFRAGGTIEPINDAVTGRPLDWQLMIEQTVDLQFTGVSEGGQSVLNPFSEEIAFVAPFGVVSSFADPITDESLTPMLLDANGKRLPPGSFRVFRQGTLTTANFDQTVIGAHVMTSAYEHVMLLPYVDGSTFIFSPLLGQAAARLFVTGERQQTKNGRLEFGGKFLRGHEMSENIEGSVVALRNLFDTASLTRDTARAERVRAMLGFHPQDYFDQRGTSSASEFRFFQGLLRSKGTNAAIDAYLNSRQFKSAYLDEYWAYKVASYGDGRPVIDVDMKVGMEDFTGDYTNFLFVERDEVLHLDDWAQQLGYDVPNYDTLPFDSFSIYGADDLRFVENFDPNGAIIIRPDDQARWYRYGDTNQLSYLEADGFVDITLTVDRLGFPYRLKTKLGALVRADRFEILVTASGYDAYGYDSLPYDANPPNGLDQLEEILREPGDYIAGTNPPEYSTPKFRRLNHSTIIIDDATLLEKTVIVRCYGPALSKFTPVKLYRYKPEVVVAADDIIWWDPARGSHHPEAYAHVDHVLSRDPAIYNESLLKGEGTQVNARRPWGPEQVGKVWWDMSKTAWLPYSDTKLYPDLEARLAAWGGIADYAELTLYEWIEASVPPANYRTLVEAGTATGEVGLGRYLYRDRTWEQRPVAWLYSPNPQQTARAALAYQTDSLVTVSYNGGSYLCASLGTMPLVLASGVKVAAAQYSSHSRLPTELIAPIGQLLITSDDKTFITGSTTNFTAPAFDTIASFTGTAIALMTGTMLSIQAARGALKLDNETVDGVHYARATFTSTGLTQRIVIPDTPAKADTPYELVFDNLGVKVICLTGYGHADTWPTPATTEDARQLRVAAELCSTAHNIVVREALPIQVQIPTNMSTLPGTADSGNFGWLAWTDPTNLSADNLAPLNRYEPLYGEWVDVDTRLAELTADIKLRRQSPWVTRAGDTVASYRDVWTRWKLFKDYVAEAMYETVSQTHDQACRAIGFTDLPVSLATAKAYVNGVETTDFTALVDGSLSYLFINPLFLQPGDSTRVIIPAYKPTGAELALDLSLTTADPSALREFRLDVPYVKLEERNSQGRVSLTRYFYWVTGKTDQALNKPMSTALAQSLLRNHDGGYAVPQVFKAFNQIDGRPNRYAMLCVRGISHLVGADNTFRLRITRDPGMRQSSEDNTLKVRHSEWTLIRPNQATRIPKELWDKLTDTLCAETALGVSLPYVQLYEHDAISDVKAAYGLGEGQVLTDYEEAKATFIGTIANTSVVRFDDETQSFMPDPIAYTGFDLNSIEARMTTPSGTRVLMGELWTNAKPKQLNELFFAVLEDALAKTTELADIFKTSFIGLGEVRTLEEAKLSVSETMIGTATYPV